jgi:hypothetical protein
MPWHVPTLMFPHYKMDSKHSRWSIFLYFFILCSWYDSKTLYKMGRRCEPFEIACKCVFEVILEVGCGVAVPSVRAKRIWLFKVSQWASQVVRILSRKKWIMHISTIARADSRRDFLQDTHGRECLDNLESNDIKLSLLYNLLLSSWVCKVPSLISLIPDP